MNEQPAHSAPHTHGAVIHWARLYDLATGWLGMGRRSALRTATVESAGLRPGEKVLDVGCGPGVLTLLARERVGPTGEAYGIDPSPEMIALAREKAAKRGLDAQFRTGVIEQLPFEDGSFDAVLSSLMLHHLPDDLKRKGFREIARVLKPGGRLLAFDMTGKGTLLWRLVGLVGHRFPDNYGRSLADLMQEAGLSPEILPAEKKQYVTILARKPQR